MSDNPQIPRDWLLARHMKKEAQLSALRRANLPISELSWAEALRDIFRPYRRVWQALGVAWLLMIAFHLTLSPGPRPPLNPATPPPEALARWFAQFSSYEIFTQVDHPH